jgi:hypothetical protein
MLRLWGILRRRLNRESNQTSNRYEQFFHGKFLPVCGSGNDDQILGEAP